MSRIAFLDYLRIFAFTSVLIGHEFYTQTQAFVHNTSIHATPRFLASLLLPWTEAGGAGVVVFFLISGYIITCVLQTETASQFLLKRAFRIYPLYGAAVLIEALLTWRLSGQIDLATLGKQLLLVGDFFGTPYALGGVEWTLRLELLFYLFMAALRHLDVLHRHRKLLPLILLTTCIVLALVAPIPNHTPWARGYLSIYAPFLALGAMTYLYEARQVTRLWFGLAITIVLAQYYYLIATFQPSWNHAHFASLAVILFLLSWASRARFAAGWLVLSISDLTYSVYLFHLWSWAPLRSLLSRFRIPWIPLDIQILIVLLLVCACFCHWLEKPATRIGRKLSQRLQTPNPAA